MVEKATDCLTLVTYNAGVLPLKSVELTKGMKYIVVWTLQRGVLQPPEQLTDEESWTVEHCEQVRKQIAKEANPWWERCDYKERCV